LTIDIVPARRPGGVSRGVVRIKLGDIHVQRQGSRVCGDTFYDCYLVPLNFAPFAEVVADRAKAVRPRRVLETAAGTGVVAEALARILPTDVTPTATDLTSQ
jgi:hypothetical protein